MNSILMNGRIFYNDTCTDLCVRQRPGGTRVIDAATGKLVAMPQNRYALCSVEGLAAFFRDLGLPE